MLNNSREEEIKESLLMSEDREVRVESDLIQPNTTIQEADYED